MGALGAGLALPFSFALALPADGYGSAGSASISAVVAAAGENSTLNRWHEYALASITPRFSWALPDVGFEAPGVLDSYTGRRASAHFSAGSTPTQISISIETGTVGDTPAALSEGGMRLTGVGAGGLQRTMIAPSLARSWGDSGSLRLTGILARQRFASPELGATSAAWNVWPAWAGDGSYGAGARIEIGDAFGERLHWAVSWQSRVSMGSYASYRGVLGESGRFDIPASAEFNLSYLLRPGFSVDAGVQRIQYSGITPFTSTSLPRRFLALLGDSTSPVFAWRDLDIYRFGWTWRSRDAGTFDLHYTTRQQPRPTSRLLERALSDGVANGTLAFGWSREFSPNAQVALAARYASSPYYLLMPTYRTSTDGTVGRFEFEALWAVRF